MVTERVQGIGIRRHRMRSLLPLGAASPLALLPFRASVAANPPRSPPAAPASDRAGSAQQQEPSAQAAPADVGKAEEVERLRFAFATLVPVLSREAAKPDQACLFPMQRQGEPRQALAHLRQEPLSVGLMQEACPRAGRRPDPGANDNVVSVTHHDDVPMRMAFPPLVCPQVEGIVQVDVGQEWRDHRTWSLPRRRPGAFQPAPVLPARPPSPRLSATCGSVGSPADLGPGVPRT